MSMSTAFRDSLEKREKFLPAAVPNRDFCIRDLQEFRFANGYRKNCFGYFYGLRGEPEYGELDSREIIKDSVSREMKKIQDIPAKLLFVIVSRNSSCQISPYFFQNLSIFRLINWKRIQPCELLIALIL